MIRFSTHLPLAASLGLFALTACCPVANELLGDPRNPYPLQSHPKVGEIVHLPTGTVVSMAQMLSVAGDARIVYIGETHDNPASHRLELQVLQALAELHPGQQALGMEMFSRSQQPALDRWIAGKLDEKAFIKESHWYGNWNMDFAYYRDLLIFARDRQIPVIALNADKHLVEILRGKTSDQLNAEELARLPKLDMTDHYQRAMVAAYFSDHKHGPMQLEGFLRVQTLWDETMAESVARFLASPAGKDKHLLVAAGGNHVSSGFGIPRRAFRRFPVSYVSIGGEEISGLADKQDRMMNVNLPEFPMVPYDFLAYLAYENLPQTAGVHLGVIIETAPTGSGLVVMNVSPGSNAEHSGIRQGDLLLAIDGEALADNFDLVYALKRKHPGDHVMLQVKREGKTVNVDVILQASGKEHILDKR
jgi:uncharacterized iron-regulated protein